jgi:hypothetical protein
MATEQRVVSGRVFNVRKLYRNVEFVDADGKKQEKKLDAFSLVPTAPTFVTDDDAANWLAETVEDKVFSWKQVVGWVLAQIPIDAGKVAFPPANKKDADKFTQEQMIELFLVHRPLAISNLGPNPDNSSEQAGKVYEASVQAESIRLFHLAHAVRTDYTSWKAEEHVVMPSQIV